MVTKLKELNKVCTIKELSEGINTTSSNILHQIKSGTVPERFYRKSGGTYIFHMDYINWHKINKQLK
jgi:hypothetical protein